MKNKSFFEKLIKPRRCKARAPIKEENKHNKVYIYFHNTRISQLLIKCCPKVARFLPDCCPFSS
jgi:hypothetical protein